MMLGKEEFLLKRNIFGICCVHFYKIKLFEMCLENVTNSSLF